MRDQDYQQLEEQARELGRDAGEAAASWYEIDDLDHAETIYRGIQDGDPVIYDTFPTPNLSGELAGDPTPQTLAEDIGTATEWHTWTAGDEDTAAAILDDLCTAWEDAAWETIQDTIGRDAYAWIVSQRLADADDRKHTAERDWHLAIIEAVDAGFTQREVAAWAGVTQPRVSQIITASQPKRCHCPSDCNCRNPELTNYCGCQCADPTKTFDGRHWITS